MTEPEMRPERADAIRSMLVEHVRTEPAVRARRRRNRIIGWSGLGVLAIGAAATAGALVLQPASVTEERWVQCLSEPTRNSDGSFPGSSAFISEDSGLPDDPIEVCNIMWESGTLEPDFDPTAVTNPPGRVPDDLQLCIADDGSAAVVPSSNESICAALGMAEPDD